MLLSRTALLFSLFGTPDCVDKETPLCICATLATLGLLSEAQDPEDLPLIPTFLVGEVIYPKIRIGSNSPDICEKFLELFGAPPCDGCEGTVQLIYPDGTAWPSSGLQEHGSFGFGCPDSPPAVDFSPPTLIAHQDDGCILMFQLNHSGVLQSPTPCSRQAQINLPALVIDVDANDDGIVDILDLVAVVCSDHDTRCDDIYDAEDVVDVILRWGQEVPIP